MITFKQFFQESAKMPALDNDKPEIYWSRFAGNSLVLLRRLDPENRDSDNKTPIHTTCEEMYEDFEWGVKHVEFNGLDWIDLHTNGFTPLRKGWSITDTLNALSHTYNIVKDVPGEWYYTLSKAHPAASVIKTYYFEVNKDEYRIGGLKSVISDDTTDDEGSIMNL